MNLDDIQKLIKIIDESNLDEVIIEEGNFKISLKRASELNAPQQSSPLMFPPQYFPQMGALPSMIPQQLGGPAPVAQQPATSDAPAAKPGDSSATPSRYKEIRSPMVGTFYRSPSPEAHPYAQVGDSITKGKVLCIIEAMKLMNEIESDMDGTIVKILVENSQPIEYDQVLFLIDPA
ncbi:MAG: acetyl-CoA carboxylase biotin carboxyl carrier protein [Chlorobiales bacterium]|jgi:acetyl-CoA carboxylase biotin carboxyl carrier protein|nr:acetyl-CoA carboxylase biotin carboxyl carrier protein [Chlorobiales bacterium]